MTRDEIIEEIERIRCVAALRYETNSFDLIDVLLARIKADAEKREKELVEWLNECEKLNKNGTLMLTSVFFGIMTLALLGSDVACGVKVGLTTALGVLYALSLLWWKNGGRIE